MHLVKMHVIAEEVCQVCDDAEEKKSSFVDAFADLIVAENKMTVLG